MTRLDLEAVAPQPNAPPPRIERLLFIADAAVADADELPTAVRTVIDAAAELYAVTPTLPGRLAWLADDVNRFRRIADAVEEFRPDHILIALRSAEHANWQERKLIAHVEERFGLPVTTYAVELDGHTSIADGPLLLCYDGSEGARQAIRHAGSLFAGWPALVVTAWQPVAVPGSFGMGTEAAPMRDFAERDRAAAERGSDLADDGVDIARRAGLRAEPLPVKAVGPTWETIVEIADREDAATIVMGSRGLVGLRAMVLGGSVSGAVVRHAKRPTLIVPPALSGA